MAAGDEPPEKQPLRTGIVRIRRNRQGVVSILI